MPVLALRFLTSILQDIQFTILVKGFIVFHNMQSLRILFSISRSEEDDLKILNALTHYMYDYFGSALKSEPLPRRLEFYNRVLPSLHNYGFNFPYRCLGAENTIFTHYIH